MPRILSILLLASGAVATQSTPSLEQYAGDWTITKILGSGDMTVSEAEARKPLGKLLVIGEKTASFAGDQCAPRSAKVSRVTGQQADAILRDAKAQRSYIHLGADSLEVSPIYIDDGCVTAFVTKHGRLVVLGYTGYFYEAIRKMSLKR